MKMNLTMPLRFYALTQEYISGEGNVNTWNEIKRDDGGVFWASWRGSYGEQAMTASSQGVEEMATVRMPYHPAVCEALMSKQVLIAKNADGSVIRNGLPDKSNANAWMIWGGVDNVKELNQTLEFRVRRYEVK